MQLQAWGKKMGVPDRSAKRIEFPLSSTKQLPDKEIDDLVEKLKDPAFAKELEEELQEIVIEQPERKTRVD